MVKKLLACIFLTALCGTVAAQELFFSGEVSTHFDNTEYTGSDCGTSRTIFAVRMTPTIGYRWNDRHSVIVGAELLKDFGSSRFLDDANMVAYYRFKNEKYGAYAGIFERDNLIGRYSRAFYSDSTLIYNPLVQGIAMNYRGRNSFAEFAIDWEGLYSPQTREKFRILFSAGGASQSTSMQACRSRCSTTPTVRHS